MLRYHPLTDGFSAYQLAYGLGTEGLLKADGSGAGIPYCGATGYGHEGLDYGSGGMINSYIPDVKLGLSLAMTSAADAGSKLCGMNCTRSFAQLSTASDSIVGELLQAVFAYAGVADAARCNTMPIDPPATCDDAPYFGTISGHQLSCNDFLAMCASSSKYPYSTYCNWISGQSLTAIGTQVPGYAPPPGYDANTTTGGMLCKATCETYGAGPCWMKGNTTGWCGSTAAANKAVPAMPAAHPEPVGAHHLRHRSGAFL